MEKKPQRTLQIASFAACMNRMRGNYPAIEEARLEGVLANFERIFRQVGWDRFATAVDNCIFNSELMFFPSVKEFKAFIPPPPEKEKTEIERAAWERDMRAKKAQHPEQFYGLGDLYVVMKTVGAAIENKDKLIPGEMDQRVDKAIAEARAKCGYHLPVPKSITEGFDHYES